MKNHNPPIVINAYERPDALKRLLGSLEDAWIPPDTDLILSLEGGANEQVVALANTFNWPFGSKQVIQHTEKLGLVRHYMYCGSLAKEHGAIVYLEDDLFVGQAFYQYVLEVLKSYGAETQLAGFSLNRLWFNGFLHTPFEPLYDGNPVFFLQIPWYQGQLYTARQWEDFENWISENKKLSGKPTIHESFKHFQKDEWFPLKTQYLAETGKYYCFPRVAHCINFGEKGTHFSRKTNFFQTELALGHPGNPLKPLKECLAFYDSYYELEPGRLKQLAPQLSSFDITADLNGLKKPEDIPTKHVITCRKPQKSILKWGLEMRPPELNLIYQIEGEHFHLCEKKYITNPSKEHFYTRFTYNYRFKLSRKQRLSLILQLIKSLFGKR